MYDALALENRAPPPQRPTVPSPPPPGPETEPWWCHLFLAGAPAARSTERIEFFTVFFKLMTRVPELSGVIVCVWMENENILVVCSKKQNNRSEDFG